VVVVVYFAVAVIPTVPWAPIKLALLLGGTYWLLRRSTGNYHGDQSTIFDQLAGTVRLRDVVVTLLMPLVAALVYGAIWVIDPGESASMVVYWVFVAGQVLGGALAYTWAVRRALRKNSSETHEADDLALSRE